MSSGAIISDQTSGKRPLWSRRLADESTLNTSFENCSNGSQRIIGTSKPRIHTRPLPKTSLDDVPSMTLINSSRSAGNRDSLGNHTTTEKRKQCDPFTRAGECNSHSRLPAANQTTACNLSMRKPTSKYIHSSRDAPRTNAPMGQSYQISLVESDGSEDKDSFGGESLSRSSSDTFQPFVRSQAPRLSLQIHDGSSTPLPTVSQTNVTGRSSFGYARDNGSVLDTPSPISRSSLDFVFRSKTRTTVDPVSRAATIQAARQAFEEKQEAKNRKLEQQQMKEEEKQTRRREKQYWRTSMRDDEMHSSTPGEKIDAAETPHATTASQQQSTSTSWKSRSKNTWMVFIIWLRTRVFKLRRKIRKIH